MKALGPHPQLETDWEYRQRFADADYWRPYVEIVCQRHGLTPCRSVDRRVPGTYPTFVVDDRWVVKFFGRLFEGALAYRVESEANRLVSPHWRIPAPAILGAGRLYNDATGAWHWPYLIYECAPGGSLSEVYDQVGFDDKLALAAQLGELTRRLHAIALDDSPVFPATWDAYAHLLAERRARCLDDHRAWGAPEHWIAHMQSILLPDSELIDGSARPRLLHADITADHMLGRFESGRWRMTHVIDFGDAMAGDPAYELIALHLDGFRCDKRLLRAYLEAYGASAGEQRALTRRAMSLTLLHRFNVLEGVLRRPGAASMPVEELMSMVWDLTSSPPARDRTPSTAPHRPPV